MQVPDDETLIDHRVSAEVPSGRVSGGRAAAEVPPPTCPHRRRAPTAPQLEPSLLLITDLDNTLYDWRSFYVAGADAMIGTAARLLNQPRPQVVKLLRDVYEQHDSVEYPFAVAAICALCDLAPRDAAAIATAAEAAFAEAAYSHLRTYPGIVETLAHLHASGVTIVAATDAPYAQALRRLLYLGIARYFAGISARQSFQAPPAAPRRNKKDAGRLTYRWQLAGDQRKPNPEAYKRIITAVGASPATTVVIGDSLDRDLQPGLAVGAQAALAQYGRAAHAPDLLLELVPQFRPDFFGSSDLRPEPNPQAFTVVDSFADVVPLFPIQQRLGLHFCP